MKRKKQKNYVIFFIKSLAKLTYEVMLSIVTGKRCNTKFSFIGVVPDNAFSTKTLISLLLRLFRVKRWLNYPLQGSLSTDHEIVFFLTKERVLNVVN